jgi:TonB family protein
VKLLQAAVLALVVTSAMLARAADDRAVKARVAPIYPEIARRMKVSGTVNIQATVDADGKVNDAKTVGGNRLLAPAAEDAVRKWSFASGSGTSKVNVEVNFTLD